MYLASCWIVKAEPIVLWQALIAVEADDVSLARTRARQLVAAVVRHDAQQVAGAF